MASRAGLRALLRDRLGERRLFLVVIPVLCLVGLSFLAGLTPRAVAAPKGNDDQSDLDRDGDVDQHDLILFCETKLKGGSNPCRDWNAVGQYWNWCDWAADPGNIARYYDTDQFVLLFEFINAYYGCSAPPPPPPPCVPDLTVAGVNQHPLRMTRAIDSKRVAASDSRQSAVFLYDVETTGDLFLAGQLKGLNRPLAVGFDAQGNLYVGSDGLDCVEVYSPEGCKLRTVGRGELKMPNDVAFDRAGNLYVMDSEVRRVFVYDPAGNLLRRIGRAGTGNGRFKFPCTLLVNYRNHNGVEIAELYVGDQGQGLVHVFDLQGNFLRALGGLPTQGMLGYKTDGKFAKLQALQFDQYQRLHVLDCLFNQVQIIDPVSGAYIARYGSLGAGDDQLRLPLDMVIMPSVGAMIVADHGNQRLELLTLP